MDIETDVSHAADNARFGDLFEGGVIVVFFQKAFCAGAKKLPYVSAGDLYIVGYRVCHGVCPCNSGWWDYDR